MADREPEHTGEIPKSPRPVRISARGVVLQGDLTVPESPSGVVVFAHGSGSGRASPRNQYVARMLNRKGLATLLLDLLSEAEEKADLRTAHLRFDIPLLSARLIAATDFVMHEDATRALPVGYFGASTGAAAALVAAARRRDDVGAVVSRGGRPDLAGEALERVRAPTLLIVGSLDERVLELNEEALAHLQGIEARLEIVEGATHLFEEAGALDRVAALAGEWFLARLPRPFTDGGPRPPLRPAAERGSA